jgi:hypothetical protein
MEGRVENLMVSSDKDNQRKKGCKLGGLLYALENSPNLGSRLIMLTLICFEYGEYDQWVISSLGLSMKSMTSRTTLAEGNAIPRK